MKLIDFLYKLKFSENTTVPFFPMRWNRFVSNMILYYIRRVTRLNFIDSNLKNERIVVSLTSFPERLPYITDCIKSLLMQTLMPSRIILWLSSSQCTLDSLSSNLLNLQKYGLEIKFVPDDFKAHKKYYYIFQEEPDAYIITVDDDIIFSECLVERLWKKHLEFPNAVVCTRGKKISVSETGILESYSQWKTNTKEGSFQPSIYIMPSTGGGVLYPPHSVNLEVLNNKVFMEIAPFTDDLWVKSMSILNNTLVVKVAEKCKPFTVRSITQRVSLDKINCSNMDQNNNLSFKNILSKYPLIKERIGVKDV